MDYLLDDIYGVVRDISILEPTISIPSDLTIAGLIGIRNDLMRGHFEGLKEDNP